MKLVDIEHSCVFFTADHHFGHEKILAYAQRPFPTIHAMNQQLIDNWNREVGANDVVFHLGDVTLGNDAKHCFQQLNGQIYLLRLDWHHDRRWLKKQAHIPLYSQSGHQVQFLLPLMVLRVAGLEQNGRLLPITLSHYPLAEWEASYHGGWHLHGHTHGNYQGKGLCLDVGVDIWGYAPTSLAQLRLQMEKKQTK